MITELRITYDDQTNNINVNGPVENKGLCYMMLECARDAVKDHCDQMQRLMVTAPTTVPTNGVRAVKRRR